MDLQLTAVFRKVPEGYVGFVQELPGANSQGTTLEEARANLQEAAALILEANRELAESEAGSSASRSPFGREATRAAEAPGDARREMLREGSRHTVIINRVRRSASTVPRHAEINELLARKICRDLGVPEP